MDLLFIFFGLICVLYSGLTVLAQSLNPDTLHPKACKRILTQDVQGRILSGNNLEAAGQVFTPDQYIKVNETFFRVCICLVKKCFRKCCPDGHLFANKTCTPSNLTILNPFEITFYSEPPDAIDNKTTIQDFTKVYGNTCDFGRYRLEPIDNPEDKFYILNTGHLFVPFYDKRWDYQMFCMEVFPVKGSYTKLPFVCFDERTNKPVNVTYAIGILISTPFMLATFLVYALIPELRNLHGRSLMCHVASLLTAYIFLFIVQIGSDKVTSEFCLSAAYILQFSFLSAFFWMNVMSFDIWWVFSGFRGFHGSARERDHKKFLLYSAYAWGGPFVIMIVSIVMDHAPGIHPNAVKPGFGISKCWFDTETATLSYFYGPIAVLLVCNLVLFSLTAVKILAVRRETRVLRSDDSRRNDDSNDNKQRFILYLKLFLVMGINWIMEVISWAVNGPGWLWYITDLGNTLQGIFIFIIFVCKPRIKRLFLSRFFPHCITTETTSSVKTATSSITSRHSSTTSKE